jgi:hypothetical protein
MAGENIRLSTTYQPNFTVHQGYFFTFDYGQDNLLQKTDDGNTAFTYPFDVLLTSAVRDAQYDGVYFWSLENSNYAVPPGPYSPATITIKRWKIDNYVCKLQQTIALTSGGSHSYNSAAFATAHYHTSLSALASGTSTIYLNDYWDDSTLMNFTTTSGAKLTLHLGPNNSGQEEDVTVSGVVASGVVLASGVTYAYAQNDPVNFYTYLWMFNNYSGTDSSTAALYKFDAYTGDYITKYVSGAYKDVNAATFYQVDSFAEYGNVDTLAYVKGTNTLFINADAAGATLPYYGSMVMENIDNLQVNPITVYSLTMNDQNVYRLQLRQDGASGDWATYNYELSTLDSFISSISLAAYPATIAANAISTSDIVAIVKDQFLQPVSGRSVTFSENATPGGGLAPNPVNTDADGEAATVFTSGTAAQEVTITAVASQV